MHAHWLVVAGLLPAVLIAVSAGGAYADDLDDADAGAAMQTPAATPPPAGGSAPAIALPPPLPPDDAPLTHVGPDHAGPIPGRIGLSLADAIGIGIERNLSLQVERHAPLIAEELHWEAWGGDSRFGATHDPRVLTSLAYNGDEQPVASSLQSSSKTVERKITGNASLLGLIPKVGAEYELGYTGTSSESTSSIQSLSPEYRTIIFGRFKLPLLRGFLWGEPWTQVKVTRSDYRASSAAFVQQLMDTVKEIEDGYWAVAAGRQSVRVAHKSLEASRALLEQTDAQYEVGVVSKVEVVEAQAGVAERELNLIQTDAALREAEDTLVNLVFGPALAPNLDVEIVPRDSPDDYRAYDVDREVAAQRAMEHRPELEVARENIEKREFQLKGAKNERLPGLDLEVQYGFTGLAGKQNPDATNFGGGSAATTATVNALVDLQNDTLPQAAQLPNLPTAAPPAALNVDRRYSGTDDDFFGADGAHQFTAKGVVSIPLFNVRARHKVTRQDIELRKAKTELRRTEQGIVLEIRNAVRNLRAALQGIAAAERRRDAAEEQFRAEGIRLEQGESTPFEVLQRERDLVDAESQRINALQVYHNSVTALDRAQGTILRNRNIEVEQARRLR